MKTIQLKIEDLRKERGISQKELADQIGVSSQSISKWENGVNMPDITLLPVISEFFNVTVDELLGLKPLPNSEYITSKSDTFEYWKNKSSYLDKNKIMLWNDDYLHFLINTVWKLDRPVRIIDFGCGTGFVGKKLLPLLPTGSSYTGIDINSYFIQEANSYFMNTEYKTEFINCDLYSYIPDKQYDIAISHAVLRHLSRPKEVLKKMTESVTSGGMVICMEVNREFENDGLYIEGMDYNYLCTGFNYHQLWNTELTRQGRDYAIGFRIPFYMKELGLHSIDSRMSDRVLFIDPQKQDYHSTLTDFISINDWDHSPKEEENESTIAFFMNRGMTRTEAEAFIKKQSAISAHLHSHPTDASLLKFLGLVISWGKK